MLISDSPYRTPITNAILQLQVYNNNSMMYQSHQHIIFKTTSSLKSLGPWPDHSKDRWVMTSTGVYFSHWIALENGAAPQTEISRMGSRTNINLNQENGQLHMLKTKWWKQMRGGGQCGVNIFWLRCNFFFFFGSLAVNLFYIYSYEGEAREWGGSSKPAKCWRHICGEWCFIFVVSDILYLWWVMFYICIFVVSDILYLWWVMF